MRTEIDKKLQVLIGSVLYQSIRAADLAIFHFRDRRGTATHDIAEYSLHVQCPWRITRDGRVFVGSSDLYYPEGCIEVDSSIEFDWDRSPNRRDELIRELFGSVAREFLVEKIEVADAGHIHIGMDKSLTLEIFPDSSMNEEYWRFFKRNSEEPHLVMTSDGIGL